MEGSSIGVWQWFHALTQTHELCLLGRQGGLRESEGQFGNDIQDPMLHMLQQQTTCRSECRSRMNYVPRQNAIRDSTSALLEHIM
jgi:hypothetical protein